MRMLNQSFNVENNLLVIWFTFHSALKLEKKVQFQKYKNSFFAISKMAKKSIFAPEKTLKLPKILFFSPEIVFLVILNFFLVQKLFFANFENANNVSFALLKFPFFPILEHLPRDLIEIQLSSGCFCCS